MDSNRKESMTDDELDAGLNRLMSEAERDKETSRAIQEIGTRQLDMVRSLVDDLSGSLTMIREMVLHENTDIKLAYEKASQSAFMAAVILAPALKNADKQLVRVAELARELPDVD